MLECKHRHKGYANYVIKGVDEEIAQYYQRGNMTAIVGGKDFKAWVYELLPELEMEEKGQVILPNITMGAIVKGVASTCHTTSERLKTVVKGPQKGNARKIAMYLCQELADVKLKDIAEFFKLSHVGSVSFITHQVRKKKRENKAFLRLINEIMKSIMKQAT
jgi:putative transposase